MCFKNPQLLKPFLVSCILLTLACLKGNAQDTLPRISVRSINHRVIISWRTTYGARITNINIQRSYDSTKNFSTIGTVLEPNNRENGFVDSKAPDSNMFYRVFVAFQGGSYVFTRSYRPVPDTPKVEVIKNIEPPPVEPTKQLPTPVTPPPQPAGWIPSKYIYTAKDNNVVIELPVNKGSSYSVKFYDEKDRPVFEIGKITEPYLIIEKVNFMHSGWFYFKLYENGVIKEKNQFYIPKEGKFGIPPAEMNKIF